MRATKGGTKHEHTNTQTTASSKAGLEHSAQVWKGFDSNWSPLYFHVHMSNNLIVLFTTLFK